MFKFVFDEKEPPETEDDHEPLLIDPVIIPCRLIGSLTQDPKLPMILTSTVESTMIV